MTAVYAKHPNERRWVVFNQRPDGSYERAYSVKGRSLAGTMPRIKWPEKHVDNVSVDALIKIETGDA